MNNSPWLLDAHGQRYDLTDNIRTDAPSGQPSLKVMAHACSQIVRFTGHAKRPYTVTEHQLLCAQIASYEGLPPIIQLACLTHDLHEAYTGDVATPIKQVLSAGMEWRAFERLHAARVRHYLGLYDTFDFRHDDIKRCDLIALATERRDLLNWDANTCDPWPILDTPGAEIHPREMRIGRVCPWEWETLMHVYLAIYHTLARRCIEQGREGILILSDWELS